MPLAAFFLSLVGPVVKRIAVALGVGLISYGAVMAAFTAVKDQLLSQYGSISADIIWVADLAGCFDFMSIVMGAMAARLALQSVARFGRLAT